MAVFGYLAPPGDLWYNGGMRQHELEPGFLQAYRLFVVTCIVFWVMIGPILAVLSLAGERLRRRWTTSPAWWRG